MKLIHCISGICLLGGVTAATAQVLMDFESVTAPSTSGSVMFRDPSFSGSTASKLETVPASSSIVYNTGIPAGNANVGNNALNASFGFVDSGGAPLWVRLTTSGASTLPNPTIPIVPGTSLKFDIWSDHAMYVSLGIRETETGAAFGASGGSSGTIEYLGGNPGGTSGPRGFAIAANTWTTVTYDFGNTTTTPVFGLTGDGVLNPGTDGEGVLESLGLAYDDTTQNRTEALNVWVDKFVFIPEPSSAVLTGLGGLAVLVFRRRHVG